MWLALPRLSDHGSVSNESRSTGRARASRISDARPSLGYAARAGRPRRPLSDHGPRGNVIRDSDARRSGSWSWRTLKADFRQWRWKPNGLPALPPEPSLPGGVRPARCCNPARLPLAADFSPSGHSLSACLCLSASVCLSVCLPLSREREREREREKGKER